MADPKHMRAAHNLDLARARVSTDPTLALRIADYVRKQQQAPEAAESLFEAILNDPQFRFYHSVLPGHEGGAFSIAFSPDARELVTTTQDKLRLWTLEGRELFSRDMLAFCSAFSPDGARILTADRYQAMVLDRQGKPCLLLPDGNHFITSVAFSPDGNLLLTGSRDGSARLFDTHGQEILQVYGDAGKVWAVAFHPDGRHFVTGNYWLKATLWNIEGVRVRDFTGHENMVFFAAVSNDGNWVLTGSRDKTVRLWDLDGRMHLQVPRDLMGVHSIHSVAFSPDSASFITADRKCSAIWYDLSGRKIATFPGEFGSTALAFSPDGKYLADVDAKGKVRIWSTQTRDQTGLDLDTFLDQHVYRFSNEELQAEGVLL